MRPTWWSDFLAEQHGTQTYEFTPIHADAPTGQLTLAATRDPERGARLTVHGFWAADPTAASAMLAFLGRWNTRVATVQFQRTGLPPYPLLLHTLPRSTLLTTRAQPPWMLRILDLQEAVRLRGWPAELDLRMGIEIGTQDGSGEDHYLLEIAKGTAELSPAPVADCEVVFTWGQFTLWYAGGLPQRRRRQPRRDLRRTAGPGRPDPHHQRAGALAHRALLTPPTAGTSSVPPASDGGTEKVPAGPHWGTTPSRGAAGGRTRHEHRRATPD